MESGFRGQDQSASVLMVVLYHAKIGSLEAGYLGVDIFFVISGFLITTLVASGLRCGIDS
jgi:peptidoglycan/LPS O-acetylase OafA/YrhL